MSEERFDDDLLEERTRRYGLRGSRRPRRGGRSGRRRRGRRSLPPVLPVLATLLGLLVIAVSSGVVPRDWLSREHTFRVERVAVRGNQRLSVEQVALAAGVEPGTPLLDVDVNAVRARLEAHPFVRRARVLRYPPGTLVVSVHEVSPVAWSELGTALGRPLLVDESGHGFAPAREEDLRLLPRLAQLPPGPPPEEPPDFTAAVRVILALREAGLPRVAEVWLPAEGSVLRVRFAELSPLFWFDGRDLPGQVARLQRLLEAELPEAATAREVDLRFADRAVLRGDPAPERGAGADVAGGDAG